MERLWKMYGLDKKLHLFKKALIKKVSNKCQNKNPTEPINLIQFMMSTRIKN